ncbi:hypothetical protein B0T20DRAFT_384155 [Sordaria brevicollis]|uniref:NADH dehydrogenase [ubiquinone] 1 alpha subcomplex subunit n=1 Tax=Sordaria brevicollis TaxID=83679 RepID=A0AAE0P252_SORBR|nr:hypothetical protein B0T20DRAFT_384155 [Sordaria brevicollis]
MSLNLKTLSPLKRAWYKWKAIKFPWRNKLLVGLDLAGNTYHIFRPTRSTIRWRRIVQYPTGRNTHFSDVSVPPSWHQWLRYTRENPPTIEEQEAEVARQERIKVLAKLADERWEAKAKYIPDTPGASEQQQPTETIGKPGADEYGQPVSPLVGEGMRKSSPYSEGTSGGVVSGVETSGVSNQEVFGSEEQEKAAREEGEKIRGAATQTAAPETATPKEAGTSSSAAAHATPADQTAGTREGTWDQMMKEQKQLKKKKGINPWKQAQASNPSGEWQPKAWDPTGNLGNKKR